MPTPVSSSSASNTASPSAVTRRSRRTSRCSTRCARSCLGFRSSACKVRRTRARTTRCADPVRPWMPAALAKLDARCRNSRRLQVPVRHDPLGLAACCVYLSYGGIQIRPMIPPTFENRVFSRAGQRVYLSATLGSGGELERAFGRSRSPACRCRPRRLRARADACSSSPIWSRAATPRA